MNQTILFIWILQIILESLPISSSGHIYFIGQIVRKYFHKPFPEIPEYLEHIMHAPTVFVLVAFLAHLYFYQGIFEGQLFKVIGCVVIADSITTVFYMLFKYYPVSKKFMPLGFMATGLLFLSLYFVPREFVGLSYLAAAVIGIAQGLAFLPGISRLGITFVIGYWLGLAPLESLGFSCAIQLPLICGALAKSMLEIVVRGAPPITLSLIDYILLIVATLVAYVLLVLVSKYSVTLQIINLGRYLLLVGLIASIAKLFELQPIK